MGPITLFSKHLGWLTIDQLGPVASEIGFTAVQLTLREGGHVEPVRAEADLRRARRTLQLAGVSVPSVVTAVTDPTTDATRRVLGAIAEAGVPRYRMGWYELRASPDARGVTEALSRARGSLEGMARLNEEFGLQGCYENHAGAGRIGASIWNLWDLVKDLPPEALGVEFDLRHARIEGWESWRPAFELLRERIGAVLVKDYAWGADGDPVDVPLGEGVAPFVELFGLLSASGWDGPVVMHFEYALAGAEAEAGGVAGRELQGRPGSVAGAPRDGFTQVAARAIRRVLERLRGMVG